MIGSDEWSIDHDDYCTRSCRRIEVLLYCIGYQINLHGFWCIFFISFSCELMLTDDWDLRRDVAAKCPFILINSTARRRLYNNIIIGQIFTDTSNFIVFLKILFFYGYLSKIYNFFTFRVVPLNNLIKYWWDKIHQYFISEYKKSIY